MQKSQDQANKNRLTLLRQWDSLGNYHAPPTVTIDSSSRSRSMCTAGMHSKHACSVSTSHPSPVIGYTFHKGAPRVIKNRTDCRLRYCTQASRNIKTKKKESNASLRIISQAQLAKKNLFMSFCHFLKED
jgi:hypothetical protein